MTLRALEPQDLELLYTIENERDDWDVSNNNVPYSRYDLENYILSQQHDIYADKQLRLVICSDEGESVGLVDLFNISPANLRAELGIAILKSERGNGYAEKAFVEIVDYARRVLHFHQLYCIVPEDNVHSLAALRKAGFSGEKILIDWLRTNDKYKNCIFLNYEL